MIRLVRPVLLSLFSRQTLRRYLSNPKAADLAALAALVAEGKLRPVVDSVYPLAETAAALRHVERGHPAGKVVICVAGNPTDEQAAASTPSLSTNRLRQRSVASTALNM